MTLIHEIWEKKIIVKLGMHYSFSDHPPVQPCKYLLLKLQLEVTYINVYKNKIRGYCKVHVSCISSIQS